MRVQRRKTIRGISPRKATLSDMPRNTSRRRNRYQARHAQRVAVDDRADQGAPDYAAALVGYYSLWKCKLTLCSGSSGIE